MTEVIKPGSGDMNTVTNWVGGVKLNFKELADKVTGLKKFKQNNITITTEWTSLKITSNLNNTTVQSPSKSESEDGTFDYVPEVKKTVVFSDSVMEDVKAVKVNVPTDAFADEVYLQVAPNSATSSQFSVDIKFVKASDGTKVQPTKPVTVKIPVPENMKNADPIYVYHTDDNGKISKIAAAIETIADKKYVVFTTSSFSEYTLSTEILGTSSNTFDPIRGGIVPNIRPVAPTTDTTTAAENTTEETKSTTAQSSASEDKPDEDKNQATGVMIAVIPAILAAADVVISKKRR